MIQLDSNFSTGLVQTPSSEGFINPNFCLILSLHSIWLFVIEAPEKTDDNAGQ